MTDQPAFRFFPAAYDMGDVLERSDAPCDVCGKPSVWLYAGTVYAEGEQPEVCARCIHGGQLAAHFGGQDFQLHDADLSGASEALTAEVMQRTPGFATFNAFDWPVIDGQPLVFVGNGDADAVWNDPELRAAITAAWKEEYEEDLDEPSSYALVFRTLDGKQTRIVFDSD
ncbi:MAG: hypothetical protein GC155_12920 [Alphaproteobacteria bacterium]|nr:hypothetical protein [Alphaproteobacteria bacterium]